MRPDEQRKHLREAYRALLRPLIRILIRSGVTATEATDLVKLAYVDAARSDEFQLAGRQSSDTRVAILTGLTRKEIKRLRDERDSNGLGTNLSRIGRLIAAWNQDPDFTGPYGLPLAIPFSSPKGSSEPSFAELVDRHAPDIAAKEMLEELVRTGLAGVDDDGLIRNSGRTYIPSNLDPAAIERLGRIVGRLANTLDFNNEIQEADLKRFERDVTTDVGLSESQYRQFRIYLKSKCQELLVTIDNWLANQEGRFKTELERTSGAQRKITTGIGIFHFLEEDESSGGFEQAGSKALEDKNED